MAQETLNKKTNYKPLFSLAAISFASSFAITVGIQGGMLQWMHYFMGFFLSQFALLKLFNVEGFAEGFKKYDLLAMKCPFYAKAYPFLEAALGLCYLSFRFLNPAYFMTVVLSVIGSIGVIRALRKGLDLRCACMGTVLDVPLSTVTLTEDIAMGVMALCMWIGGIG